MNKLFLYI